MTIYDHPSPASPAPAPTNTMAIISLVAGILGLTVCGGIGSIVALITGYSARRDIEANPGQYSGRELATIGIILGWIGIGLVVIGLALAFLILVLGIGSQLLGANSF